MAKTIDRMSADKFCLKLNTAKVDMDAAGARIDKWGGESSIGLQLPFGRVVPQLDKDKVVYSRPDMDVVFYGDGMLFEYEIVLKAHPGVSELVLPFNMQNLQAHYQGELDGLAKAEGHIRPPEVVGSYAFYHGSRMMFMRNGVGGKAGHLYRPKAIDATGKELWLPITLEDGKLTLSLDPLWFVSAHYPVKIDPTFGLHTQGGTVDTSGENRIKGSWDTTDASGGVASTMYVWVKTDIADKEVKCAIYEYDGVADAGGRLDYTAGVNVVANGAAQKSISVVVGYTLAASTNYFLLAWGQADGGGLYFYYDSVSDKGIYKTEIYNGWPAELTGESGIARQYSVSCDYSAAAGISIPVAMRSYRNLREN